MLFNILWYFYLLLKHVLQSKSLLIWYSLVHRCSLKGKNYNLLFHSLCLTQINRKIFCFKFDQRSPYPVGCLPKSISFSLLVKKALDKGRKNVLNISLSYVFDLSFFWKCSHLLKIYLQPKNHFSETIIPFVNTNAMLSFIKEGMNHY